MNDSNQRREKILIIDSSPDAIRSLAGALPPRFTKLVATSGAKAFEVLAATGDLPSLILLETFMPLQDGYEICSLLKADTRYRDIPVIFISSKNETREKVEGLQRGAVDFIPKPFDPGEVQSRVDVHLKIFNLQQELKRRQHDLEDLVEAKAKEVTDMQLATIFALVRLTDRRDDKNRRSPRANPGALCQPGQETGRTTPVPEPDRPFVHRYSLQSGPAA
jgi:PleD family two-component response regulator